MNDLLTRARAILKQVPTSTGWRTTCDQLIADIDAALKEKPAPDRGGDEYSRGRLDALAEVAKMIEEMRKHEI